MKRLFCLIVLLVALLHVLFAQNAELPRLAVVEFNTNINDEKTKADAITVRDLVESHMIGTRKYRIITRDDIDKLLANQKIQISSISSAENLTKLKLQNISYIVTGSVDAIGDNYALTVRVLDVSTGQFSHSIDDFLTNSSRGDLYKGITGLISKFVAGMSATTGGVLVQGTVTAPTIASIEVYTDKGGDLYFQGNKVVSVWDKETHIFPIEKPGLYTLSIVFPNKSGKTVSIKITSRGTTKLDFSIIPEKVFTIGSIGPAGGIIFYDKRDYSDGWRYLEAAPPETEFIAKWGAYNTKIGTNSPIGSGKRNTKLILEKLSDQESGTAAQLCVNLYINGYKDWFLPSLMELAWMYDNLRKKGIGSFNASFYWSSEQHSGYYDYAWCLETYSNSFRYYHVKKNENTSVRAVRAF